MTSNENKIEDMRARIAFLTRRPLESCQVRALSKDVYTSFQDLRENPNSDSNIVFTQSFNVMGDMGALNYRILESVDRLSLHDKNLSARLDDGRYALPILVKDVSFHNSKESTDVVKKLAISYAENEDKMQYDMYYAHSWYFKQINKARGVCSDLACLVANGVDFDNSVLNIGGFENRLNEDWKYLTLDELFAVRPDIEYRRKNGYKSNINMDFNANDIAALASYFNLLFEVDEFQTNLEPGDIIFFSSDKDKYNGGYFLNIYHVGVYIGNDQYVDWGDDNGHAIKVRYIEGFMPSVAMRLPLETVDEKEKIQETFYATKDLEGYYKGQKLTGYIKGDYFIYYLDGKEMSISKEGVTKDFIGQVKYPIVKVAVREEPRASSQLLGFIDKGMEITGRPTHFFFEIDFQGKRGYVNNELLTFNKPKASKKWYQHLFNI